jgi:hypothetical protein
LVGVKSYLFFFFLLLTNLLYIPLTTRHRQTNRQTEIFNLHSNRRQTRGSKMSEWDTVISVLGTLGGTGLGLVLGYWTSSHIETKRQRHETEMAYRNELIKHIDDLFKPLFVLVEAVWGDIGVLETSITQGFSIIKGKTMKDLLTTTQLAVRDLKNFVEGKYTEIGFLIPNELSAWVFAPIFELIDYKILEPLSKGEKPIEEMTLAVNMLMKYQKNLKRLLGYETMEKLEQIYPFEQQIKPESS